MNQSEKFSLMTLEQLAAELAAKKELLEEVQEEKKFWLCHTSIHVPGHKARRYEAEIAVITASIAEIEQVIQKKQG